MEQWKDIKGFESVYQVSNFGNIRSLDRVETNSLGQRVRRKGRLLKPIPNSSGYLRIELRHEGKRKRAFVHRVVAEAFCVNSDPEINVVVNHIDNNFLNNSAVNLEWTTLKGNSQHALKSGRMSRTKEWVNHLKKSLEWTTRTIEAYDPITGEVKERFSRLTECRNKGYDPSSVCMCCKGKRNYHKGLCWRYSETR